MKITRQIKINKTHKYFADCDNICFLSKNLYNQAIYRIRTKFEKDGVYLSYFDLTREMNRENQVDFRALQSAVSQQTLIQIDMSYKGFFRSIKGYHKSPSSYRAKPNPPNFKNKKSGRFMAVFTKNAISEKFLKLGLIKLSGVNFFIKTDLTSINQVRIVPKGMDSYVIEIIYEKKEKEKVENNNYAGIDIGLNNLATIVTNTGTTPTIINGKPLKSINQYYNKKKASMQSKLPFYITKDGTRMQRTNSKSIRNLTTKRNNKIKDYLHKASRKVVNHLQQNDISLVVVGQNKEWKQSINLRKATNQNFVAIPHARFISMCEYKSKLEGIELRTREESYTSKCSFLDNEAIRKHNEYLGKRIKRGLFRTSTGIKWNSDCNGAANILRKEVPNAFVNGIEGVMVSPNKYSL